jgi:MerR family transcriptional regulator/heat shock protein HspR
MPSLPLDDENLPLFTVGQVSQMLEIQQAFLRRLDRLGVVSPDRSEGNQRRYTRREVTVVRYVVDLVDEGMTLAAVRRVLELEAIVHDLMAERDALRAAVAERDARLAERDARLAERDAQLARLSAEPPGRRGSAPSPEPRGR